MRRYVIEEPWETFIVTEEEVERSFYPHWRDGMKDKFGDEDNWPCENTAEEALKYWIALNWAHEVKDRDE